MFPHETLITYSTFNLNSIHKQISFSFSQHGRQCNNHYIFSIVIQVNVLHINTQKSWILATICFKENSKLLENSCKRRLDTNHAIRDISRFRDFGGLPVPLDEAESHMAARNVKWRDCVSPRALCLLNKLPIAGCTAVLRMWRGEEMSWRNEMIHGEERREETWSRNDIRFDNQKI